MPKLVAVKLAPTPKTTSASATCIATARGSDAARAERQRMVLGERALALEARGHRRFEQLGSGFSSSHALA